MNARLFSRMFRNEEDFGGDSAPAAPVADAAPAEPALTSASEASDVNTDWSAIVDDSDAGAGSAPAPAAEATPPAPAAPAATTPATPAPTTPAAPAEPAAPAAAPVPPPAEPAPATPAEPTQPSPVVDVAQQRNNYLSSLRQYYALSPENAARMQTEPELVLPELAATLHLEVVDAVMNMLPQHVTQLVHNYTETTKRNAEAEDTFFKAYPELTAYKAQVLSVGQMYRAANPKATKDQAVKAIGDFLLHSLGIQRAQQSVAVPATPAPVVNPFVPATSSSAPQVAPQRGEWDFVMEPDD